MNALIVISNISLIHSNSAGAVRMSCYAKALCAQHNIAIFTTTVDMPYVKEISNSNINGRVIRLNYFNKNVSLFFNKTYIGYFIQLFIFLRKNKSFHECKFLLYPTNNAGFDLISLLFVKLVFRRSIFCEVNELRMSYLVNRTIGYSPVRWLKFLYDNIIYRLADRLLYLFDGLIVISTNLEKRYAVRNKNIIRIPILIDSDNIEIDTDVKAKEESLFKIGFFGSINLKKEGFEGLYYSLSLLKLRYKEFKLILIGNIPQSERKMLLQILPKKYRIIENIDYQGKIPHERVLNVMRTMDLLILPRPDNLQTRYGFSTKLGEYLLSGRPVLVTDVSDNSYYIKNDINGYIVPPGDPIAMHDTILHIINVGKAVSKEVGINGYETAMTYFDYKKYSEKLNDYFNPSSRKLLS